MDEAKGGTVKRLAWQFYIAYFLGGFVTSVVFEGFLLLTVYFNSDAVTVATIWAVAWVFCLFIYVFIRSCCKWWLGDDDVLDELAAQRRNRGESQWDGDAEGVVANGANGQKITMKDLFVYESNEMTASSAKRSTRDRERRIVIVGFLSSALGIVGGFAAAYFFQQYWYFANGPTYHDVSATANPDTISDAHLIYFDSSTVANTVRFGGEYGADTMESPEVRCAAPLYAAGAAADAAVAFWACAAGCCGQASGSEATNEKCANADRGSTFYPGMTCRFPRINADGVRVDGDRILGERIDSGKDLVSYTNAAADAVACHPAVQRLSTSMYFRVMSQSEHDAAQRARLYTAWLCLVAGPLGWPVTIGAMILLEVCLEACNLFDPDPAKRCNCCYGGCKCCDTFGADQNARGGADLSRGGLSADEQVLRATQEAQAKADHKLTGVELRELAAKKRADIAAGERLGTSSTPRF